MSNEIDRPHFVYGTLRPGELAHRQITEFVERSEAATLHGWRLYVRDGLPLITREPGHSVDGDVLFAGQGCAVHLAKKIAEYEGDHLYYSEDVSATGADGLVNALAYVGRSPAKGGASPLDRPWASVDDPLLTSGLATIAKIARAHFQRPESRPMPADMRGFWDVFIPLQGTYLTLCAILERYTALVYGPALEPNARLKCLRTDPDAQDAVQQAIPPPIDVLDSRDPRVGYRVPGPKSFEAWYQVRSNLSHRGKAAYADFDLVERSIVGLHDSLRLLLDAKLSRPNKPQSVEEMLRATYENRARSDSAE